MRSLKTPWLLHTLVPAVLFSSSTVPLAAQVGSVIDDLRIDGATPGLDFSLASLGAFGTSIASLGDLDGDGLLEFAVGQSDIGGGNGGGAVRIVELTPSGGVSSDLEISEGVNGFAGGLTNGDEFGFALAYLGDLDGDGAVELAVGTSGDNDGAGNAGAVWILSLEASGTVRSSQKISATSGGLGSTLGLNDRFGWSLAPLGDLDGDGIADLAVGAPGSDGVYLLLLNPDRTVKSEVRLDTNTPVLGAVIGNGASFGSSLALLGDLDGGGGVDLAIGAPFASFSEGSVIVVALNSDGTVATATALPDPDTPQVGGIGQSLGVLGDLDGDGSPELGVGMGLGSLSVSFERFFVVRLDEQAQVLGSFAIEGEMDSLETRADPGDGFGSALLGVGDMDADGVDEVLVGSRWYSEPGFNTNGAIYVLDLSDGDPVAAFSASSGVTGCAPLSVDFVEESSGSGVSAWSWDFGDGSTSTAANPTHTYTDTGTYSVTLRVAGAEGQARAIRHDLVVIQTTPSADFDAAVTTGVPPLSVAFEDRSSAGLQSWLWDFGDGGTSTEQNPAHVYAVVGTYDVALTVTCASGTDTQTKAGFVVVSDGPDASVSVQNGSGVNPLVLSSLVDPVVGTTWMGELDGGSVGATGLAFFFGYTEPLDPGVLTGFGELLIDPTSDFVALQTSFLLGGIATIALPIPNDVALLGFSYSGQGFLNNVAGAGVLTNRLDYLLGS